MEKKVCVACDTKKDGVKMDWNLGANLCPSCTEYQYSRPEVKFVFPGGPNPLNEE